MKTINIQGKEYVTVNERLKYFRENFKGYRLLSDLVSDADGVVIFRASILNDKGETVATGYAREKENSTFINKTSHIENCETSAWGRALANFGIGIDSSVASADEVANAVINQSEPTKKEARKKYQKSVAALEETIKKEDLANMLADCVKLQEVIDIWWLLTDKQQSDEDIKEWFSIRKQQLKDAGIYV